MRAHYCLTENDEPTQGPLAIVCLCSTGRDHTEDEFDSPAYLPEDDDDPPAVSAADPTPLADAA